MVLAQAACQAATIEEALTFKLTFDDEKLAAQKSAGPPEPIEITGKPAFVDGLRGKALFLGENVSVTYASRSNLAVPGAISFRLRVDRDRLPGKGIPFRFTHFFLTRYKPDGYLGVQDSVYGQLNLFLHGFPDMRMWNVSEAFPWEKGRWFHVLVNLHGDRVELFLDGTRLAGATLERPLKPEELGPFVLGSRGPNGFAIDEVLLFSRPLGSSEAKRLAMGNRLLDGRICWFPSLGSIAMEAWGDAGVRQLNLRVVVTDRDEAKHVLADPLTAADWTAPTAGIVQARKIFKLPALADGVYKTWIENDGEPDAVKRRLLERTFVVKRYEWLHNRLGESDVIIPPFTPLVVDGGTVKCVLREHALGELGLWSHVRSLGRDVLARPITLRAYSRGKALVWEGGALNVTEAKPHRVRAEAAAANALMNVASSCEFDYDGMMLVTLRIAPKSGEPLERFFLDIPIRKDVATLFHAVGERIRDNPAGAVPPGTGVVWESRRIPAHDVENFIPYVWVGGEERGISWTADWDRDWVHSKDRSAIELIREEDGTVVIRVNLIDGPVALARPREITFALQASPVKPMPPSWREQVFEFENPGTGKYTILWPPSWGGHYGWSSRYPLDHDFSIVRKVAEAKRKGDYPAPAYTRFIEQWVRRVMEQPGRLEARDSADFVRNHVLFSFNTARAQHAVRGSKLLFYSVACETTDLLPEDEVYHDEWQFRGGMHASASFRDYAVWYANRMMEEGMEGIYVDNSFPMAKFTWPTGEGYVGDDGEVHPNFGILSRTRPLIRRLAVMMHEKGREPFVRVHMTNANILPMLSFAQSSLGWEWKYGTSDFQERFTSNYVRAVNIGRQSGTVPNVLGGIEGVPLDGMEGIRLTRSALAATLPHEMLPYARVHSPTAVRVRDIVYDFVKEKGVEAFPYWEDGGPVRAPEGLLVTAYRAGRRLLFVVGNAGGEGNYTIRVDPARLGWNIAGAVNRETGAEIPVKDNMLTLRMGRHDLALIEARRD
ncbi:MAG TPA: glycoside hydrolase domain-containing protein [Planctomycetota bacterium]|nr:glycoside hydrolase domain-containing protein [Planctomycetota bacterium]